MNGGIGQLGRRISPAGPRTKNLSSVTSVSTGAPLDFQSGISRLRPTGSMTAPDKICAPTSEPFSKTTTEMSLPVSMASCFKRMAAESPAGPAPTITQSNSIASRGGIAAPFRAMWVLSLLEHLPLPVLHGERGYCPRLGGGCASVKYTGPAVKAARRRVQSCVFAAMVQLYERSLDQP